MRLSKVIEAYISHKRSLGMYFRSNAVLLRAFVKSAGDGDIRQVRPQAVRSFLDGKGPVTSFWFAKYYNLTAFYRYAIARHYVDKSPLPRSTPQEPEKFQPYIYTNDDMRKLIDAADSRHRSDWLLTPDTVRTLLLLLYGTGLRISEALHLNLEDFDRDAGVLTIRETKFFKSRLIPIGPDLHRVLEAYIGQQWPPAYRMGATPLLGTVKRQRILRQTAELVYTGISILLVRRRKNTPLSARLATFFAFVPTAKPPSCPAGPLPRPKSRDLPDFEAISQTPLPQLPSVVQIGFAWLARLSGRQRQSQNPPQHACEQAPRQVALGQHHPVVPSVLD